MEKYYGDYDLSVRWQMDTPSDDLDSSYTLPWTLDENDAGWVDMPLSDAYVLTARVGKDGGLAPYAPMDSAQVRENLSGGWVNADSLSLTVDFLSGLNITAYTVTGRRR